MRYNWFFIKSITILIVWSLCFDLEIFLFVISFIYLHFKKGLFTIVIDYVHDFKLALLFNYLIKIILLENIRYLLEILT